MREIQAPRAWYKPLGVMIQPENVVSIDFDTDVVGVYLEMDGKGFHRLRRSDFKLMWPTGIEGKNLFDGDIVISDEYPIRAEDGYVGVIEHDDGVFWLTRRKKKDSEVRGMSDGIADYLYEHKDANLVRIGNIYENPELLGGTGA